jgi:tRNA G37 N-methylase Trm5
MSKSNRWQKAIVVLTQGGVFSAEKLCEEMEYDCVYRVSNVLLDTKIFAGAIIKSVRDGRKVVGYELVNIDEMKQLIASGAFAATATKAVAKPKTTTVKTAVAKTVKPVKAKKVTPVPVRAGDSLDGIMSAMAKSSAKKPVNLLDEIDTDVEDFEDRQFAEAYIRT